MKESNSDLKTNQLDGVQTSLVCLIESEAEEMLSAGQHIKVEQAVSAKNRIPTQTQDALGLVVALRSALDSQRLEQEWIRVNNSRHTRRIYFSKAINVK